MMTTDRVLIALISGLCGAVIAVVCLLIGVGALLAVVFGMLFFLVMVALSPRLRRPDD